MVKYQNLIYEDKTFEKCIGIFLEPKIIKLHPNTKSFAVPRFQMENLKEIICNENLELIDTFFEETQIETLDLRNTKIKKILSHTFENSKIDSIYLPKGLEYIGNRAFNNCENLTNINLEYTNVRVIGNNAFEKCLNLNTSFPETVELIRNDAFKECAVENVNLSNTKIKKLEFGVFAKCEHIKEVILPETLEEVDAYAFARSSIKHIKLPESIQWLNGKAFYECKELDDINIPDSLNIEKLFNIKHLEYINNFKKIYCSEKIANLLREFIRKDIKIVVENSLDELLDTGKTFKQINDFYKNKGIKNDETRSL